MACCVELQCIMVQAGLAAPDVLCCVSGGYGGMRGEVALDLKEECIQAAGLSHVLCTSWRNDNSGGGGLGPQLSNI